MQPFICPLCGGAGTHEKHNDADGRCNACHGTCVVWSPEKSEGETKFVPTPYPQPYPVVPHIPWAPCPRPTWPWITWGFDTTNIPINRKPGEVWCGVRGEADSSGTYVWNGTTDPTPSTITLSIDGKTVGNADVIDYQLASLRVGLGS